MPSRTICSVLEEIRKCQQTHNYSYLLGLVEEAQTLANRMEAALWDQDKFIRAKRDYEKHKKELKKADKR